MQETASRTCSRYMGMTSKRDGVHLVSRREERGWECIIDADRLIDGVIAKSVM